MCSYDWQARQLDLEYRLVDLGVWERVEGRLTLADGFSGQESGDVEDCGRGADGDGGAGGGGAGVVLGSAA